MADIDIGAVAIDRVGHSTNGETDILKDNPANASGTINSIEVWAAANIADLRIGIFYLVSGTDYKCRSSVDLGAVTAGSKQTFTVDKNSNPISLSVETGDYIGYYHTGTGYLEVDGTGGAGVWVKTGEYIDPGDQATYTYYSGYIISVYGTGTTGAYIPRHSGTVGVLIF